MKRRTKKPTGYVLWRGASRIDGAPIVAIVTMGTSNRKTGAMRQTWILREDVAPVDAVKTGADESICGDCPLRGINGKGRGCYVNVGQAPQAVWKTYRRGGYPFAYYPEDIGAGAMVRVGAYGDPYAVPAYIWERLLSKAAGNTGYTHQWRQLDAGAYRAFTMASADTATDGETARSFGWRTFRLADVPAAGEIVCPSENGVQCVDCGLCDGERAGNVKSITIPAHGTGARYARAAAMA